MLRRARLAHVQPLGGSSVTARGRTRNSSRAARRCGSASAVQTAVVVIGRRSIPHSEYAVKGIFRPRSARTRSARRRPWRSPSCARGARRRSVGEPGLKIWKPSRASCSGRCEWPNTTASARGSAGAAARAGRSAGPPSCVMTIRAPSASTTRTAGSRTHSPGVVHVPVDRVHRRPERLEQREHLERDRGPRRAGSRRRRASRSTHAAGSAARPARHVGVADDREPHRPARYAATIPRP